MTVGDSTRLVTSCMHSHHSEPTGMEHAAFGGLSRESCPVLVEFVTVLRKLLPHLQKVCLEAVGHMAAHTGGCSIDCIPNCARAFCLSQRNALLTQRVQILNCVHNLPLYSNRTQSTCGHASCYWL